MIYLNGVLIDDFITKFPDGTSQVWHLPEKLLPAVIEEECCRPIRHYIYWRYTDDSELLKMQQLVDLLAAYVSKRASHPDSKFEWRLKLSIPFLPYARQDKEVSNAATFALNSFFKQLEALFKPALPNNVVFRPVVLLTEPHNLNFVAAQFSKLDVNLYVTSPDPSGLRKYYKRLRPHSNSIIFVLPDAGAATRYFGSLKDIPKDFICLQKSRDAETGKITNESLFRSLKLAEIERPELLHAADPETHFVVLDDLCDGGATFVQFAQVFCYYRKQVSETIQTNLHLFVTHGIFSAGVSRLLEQFHTVTCTDSTFGLPGVAARVLDASDKFDGCGLRFISEIKPEHVEIYTCHYSLEAWPN